MKAVFCLVSYTVVEPGNDPLYVSPFIAPRSDDGTDKQGAIKLVNIIFPPPPRPKLTPKEKKEAKAASAARAKQKAETTEKDAEKEAEKERAERRARHAKQGKYIDEHS
jgi:hypothetical protein